MPFCYVHTNLKESEVKDGTEVRIAKTVAEVLGKPLDKISVVIIPGLRVYHHGSTEPACTLNIHSIAVFDAQRNPKYTPGLKKVLQDEFGLPEERCAIIYHDLDNNFRG